MEDITRVALYIRVSTEEQAQHGLSVETQTDELTNWAKRENMKVVDYYVDAGISARKKASKRPELQRLLQDVRDGKIDLVVFTKLDRWFRNVSEYYKVQEVLDDHKVAWKTIKEDYETATSSGRLKVNIMLSVAQDEADRTSERIKAVLETKRQKREVLNGNKPTGYIIEGKKFIKDPAKEEMINDFYRKFLECGGIGETQDYIQNKYNIRLGYYVVDKLLSCTAYYGFYNGVEGMCPAYITKEQFDKIQTIRQRVGRMPKRRDRVYMFTGILFCGECGYRLGGRSQKTSKYPTYNCPERYLTRRCTNSVSMSESKIEQYLIDHIEEKIRQYKVDVLSVKAAQGERDIEKEISAINGKIKRLKDLYINEFISFEEYKNDRTDLESQIKSLEKERPENKMPKADELEKIISGDWRSDYMDLGRKSQRDFWRMLVKAIYIYPDRRIDFELCD